MKRKKAKNYTNQHALIICNGELTVKLLRKFIKPENSQKQYLIIAADGASDFLYRHKILPDYIIGDLDSITPRAEKYFQNKKVVIRKIHDQNKNDLEKCIIFALSKKFGQINIIGAAGKRFDHSLNNLSVIKKYSAKADIKCYNKEFEFFFAKRQTEFACRAGDVVSLLAFPRASGITTKGLKYTLKNGTLEFGRMQGALNTATSNAVCIEIKKGTLLIFHKI